MGRDILVNGGSVFCVGDYALLCLDLKDHNTGQVGDAAAGKVELFHLKRHKLSCWRLRPPKLLYKQLPKFKVDKVLPCPIQIQWHIIVPVSLPLIPASR